MTQDEQNQLRADVAAYLRGTEPAPEPLPLPAAANRAALSPEKQELLFENWIADIDKRPSSTWTPEEKDAYRFAALRAARTL